MSERRKQTRDEWIESLLKRSSDECINWPFAKNSKGYGRYNVWHKDGVKNYRANRYICERAHGPPPSEKHQAAHTCGNPSCVNPRHLKWATQVENESDKVLHGTSHLRYRNPKTKKPT